MHRRFGALHRDNPNASWLSTANTAIAGILLSWAYVRTRSLWLPYGIHLGWNVGLGITVSFLPLLFPTGRLLSRRWRPAAWLAGIGIALLVLGDSVPPIAGVGQIGDLILAVAIFALLGVTLAVVTSLIIRYRRAAPAERLQLKWFMTAAILVGVTLALQVVLQALGVTIPGLDIAFSIILLGLPASIAIAVLKYRLYEIDLIISRALVFGALAVFITLVYVAVVVGVGALIRSRGQFITGFVFQIGKNEERKSAQRHVETQRACDPRPETRESHAHRSVVHSM